MPRRRGPCAPLSLTRVPAQTSAHSSTFACVLRRSSTLKRSTGLPVLGRAAAKPRGVRQTPCTAAPAALPPSGRWDVRRRAAAGGGGGAPGAELLCTVRGLLKKMDRRVLVGDRVRVAAVDWADRSGAPDRRVGAPSP